MTNTKNPTSPVLALEVDELTRRLDRLNLTQALLDFEVANARVLDLTARLVESNKRVIALQVENESYRNAANGTQASISALMARQVEIESSTTYRVAQKLGSFSRLRRLLRK